MIGSTGQTVEVHGKGEYKMNTTEFAQTIKKVVAQRERGIITDEELANKTVELTTVFVQNYK